MKKINLCFYIFITCLISLNCSSEQSNNLEAHQTEMDILRRVKAVKTLNTYDKENCNVYWVEPGENASKAQIKKEVDHEDIVEGEGAFKIKYSFSGSSTNASTEYVSLEEIWADYRPDLSFHPLGLSIWVKGKYKNSDVLRIMFIQDEKLTGQKEDRHYFAYTNETALGKEGWQRIIIPYSSFKHYKGDRSEKLNLARFIGYRIDVINKDGKAHSGEFKIDALEQLTSYSPKFGTPKFSSLFIQLNQVYENEDWDANFKACKDAEIDILIIQYSHGFGEQNKISWYSECNTPWNEKEYPIIDKMVEAAERQNIKLIFGLYGGDYAPNKNDPKGYKHLVERNKIVADELYSKFGNSPCFAGWYITEEFHDGSFPNGCWQNNPARDLLANYLQQVAQWCKAKPKKYPVYIAPALFRGRPADLCGEWFKAIFKQTPDVDVLLLQDIGGRCLVDVDVDLPNYFEQIKKACDETGIEFGVDVESFQQCWCPDIPYRAKGWEDLKEQLFVAGMFTQNITNFSWATFRPGTGAFEAYKSYIKQQ